METAFANGQITVIDKSIEEFRGGSAILISHQDRVRNAIEVGQAITRQWEQAYAIEDEEARRAALAEADTRSNNFLVNCGTALKQMQESRKGITQLMDTIRGLFTEQENLIDPKKGTTPSSIQTKRNQYAKELQAQQEEQRRAAEAKAAKAKEEVEIRAHIRNGMSQGLLNFLATKKLSVTNAFNAITLNDFDHRSANLHAMKCDFPLERLAEATAVMPFTYRLQTATEYTAILSFERENYDVKSFFAEYSRQLLELKQSLIARLPTKKAELEEQKRLADEGNAQRIAEAAAEQLLREKEERERLEREAAEAQSKASAAIEVEKAAGSALALFGEAEATATGSAAPETRSGYEINVLHAAGWLEIFTFWFQREGATMSVEDIGNKKPESMKKFVEKVAKDNGEKIESNNLVYEPIVKSVNRKAK